MGLRSLRRKMATEHSRNVDREILFGQKTTAPEWGDAKIAVPGAYITVERCAAQGMTDGDIIEFGSTGERVRVTTVEYAPRQEWRIEEPVALTRRERLLRWLEPKAAWCRTHGRQMLEGAALRTAWATIGAGLLGCYL